MADKSSNKVGSNPFAADSSPELLQQLGRAVFSYSMKRLSGQGKSPPKKSNSTERRQSASRSKDRDKGPNNSSSPTASGSRGESHSRNRHGEKDRDSGSDRSEGTDLHHILAQVAVGLFGYGIRQYLHHRKLSKQRAATARKPRRRPGDPQVGSNQNPERKSRQRNKGVGGLGQPGITRQGPSEEQVADPELAAALESITADLDETSKAIRKLAGKTPAHECEVHERLKNEADAIQGGLERVQTSVNNVRNLHGGLRMAKTMPPDLAVLQADSGRRAREQQGPVTDNYEPETRRRKRPRDYSPRREWDGDGRRIRGLDSGGGYRHSSRLYSRRDRDREERRR